MALPLKSGADLYNQQLIRAAIWNNSADVLDPKEYATGLMYFNTNPSSNMYQKLRFRTGTDWKTIAFAEDLDVAANKDFLALKEKVDLLSGEVDTDAIINNMKEVTAFLEGFAEDANLMTMLNNKLDKSGGTIETNSEYYPLILATSAELGQTGIKGKIGTTDIGAFVFSEGNTYLYNYKSKIGLGIYDGIAKFGSNTLLHSGNVGDYALKIDGSNKMTADNGIRWLNETDFDTLRTGLRTYMSSNGTSVDGVFPSTNYGTVLHVGISAPKYAFQLASSVNTDGLFYRGYYASADRWSDWKQIAFTEFANAQELQWQDASGNAQNVLFLDGYNDLVLGKETSIAGYRTRIQGNSVELRYNTNQSVGLILNSSGNVTIGGSDLAGTNNKLLVNGNARVVGDFSLNPARSVFFTFGVSTSRGAIQALHDGVAFLPISLNPNGGNVGIGLSNPQAKLHVSQDIVANGTIACKGVAAEGSAPVGTVDKWAGSIASGTKSQTYTHGLGTTDITVAIYEKNGNEWVQILTDVDIVNANTIRVTFGANTTVEHRIVVMG